MTIEDKDADAKRTLAEVRRRNHRAVQAMLDALAEALAADMESGAHWMNEANAQEFQKKYPRFSTLFNHARKIDWSQT